MNQHNHEYSIIQHVITHADKLWQILNREKICLELKKKKNKTQQHYKNFDQHYYDNFQLQDQNKNQWSFHQNSHWNSQQDFQQESHDIQSFFRQDCNESKLSFFISEHNYCRKNNLCFKCSLSNHSTRSCKFFFNLN